MLTLLLPFCKASAGDFYLVNTNRASATLDVLNYAYRRPPDTGGCFLLNVVEVRGATSSGIFVMFYHPNKAWTFVKTKIVSAVDSSVAQTECKNSQTVFAVLAENSV